MIYLLRRKDLAWAMVLMMILLMSTPLWAAAQQEQRDSYEAIFDVRPSDDSEDAYDVVIRGQTALQLEGEMGGLTADERARIIAGRLTQYFSNGGTVHGIRPAVHNERVVVSGDQEQLLVTVPPEGIETDDGQLSAEETALMVANRFRTMLGAEPLSDSVAAQLQQTVKQEEQQVLGIYEGTTTWYGDAFHGRRTASGVPFDVNKLTAAHKTWPFGTIVRVTSKSTQKSVVVEINDRGPFTPGLDLDLSKAAANQIGIIGKGVDKVTMEILRWGGGH